MFLTTKIIMLLGVISARKLCTQSICGTCSTVVASGDPAKLLRKCRQIINAKGCCAMYRVGSGGLFRTLSFQKCSEYQLTATEKSSSLVTLNEFNEEEINTYLKKMEEIPENNREDKYNREDESSREERSAEISRVSESAGSNCEFSLESSGMIVMYAITVVLCTVAILAVFIVKKSTQLRERLATGEDTLGSGVLSAFLTAFPVLGKSNRGSTKSSVKRKKHSYESPLINEKGLV